MIWGLPCSDRLWSQGWGQSTVAWLWGAVPPLPPSTYPVKDVIKAVRAGDIEAEEQDTGVGVEEGPQAVIVNLPWGEWGWAFPSDLPQHQGGHPSRWGSRDQGLVVCLVF